MGAVKRAGSALFLSDALVSITSTRIFILLANGNHLQMFCRAPLVAIVTWHLEVGPMLYSFSFTPE